MAKLKVKHHHTTIQEGYQAVAHIGGIRATVKVVSIKEDSCLRVGDTGTVLFKFMYGVELLESGNKVMLRECTTKAL